MAYYHDQDPYEESLSSLMWQGQWEGQLPHGNPPPIIYNGYSDAGHAESAAWMRSQTQQPSSHEPNQPSHTFDFEVSSSDQDHDTSTLLTSPPTSQSDLPEEHNGSPYSLIESAGWVTHFLSSWAMDERASIRPDLRAVGQWMLQDTTGTTVSYPQLQGDECDIQGINWKRLRITRKQARFWKANVFRHMFRPNGDFVEEIPRESFFRFAKMDFHAKIHSSHFELRNNFACSTRWHSFFPTQHGIERVETRSEGSPSHSTTVLRQNHICTVAAGPDVVMAGTLQGRYSLTGTRSESWHEQVEGSITGDHEAIINHLDIYSARQSNAPRVTIASNDRLVKVMDLETQKMIQTQSWKYPWSLSCTAMSVDRRLRVMAGDGPDTLIVDAERGEVTQRLGGERLSRGTACAWSDDGWTLATATEDYKIHIWDARKWGDKRGNSAPVCTIWTEVMPVRKLKFSPIGSGKPVLVAAEDMDYINIIDAQMYATKQTVDVFSEINGLDFTNDGQDLKILCSDPHRGGILHLERLGLEAEPQLRKWRKEARLDREDMLWDARTNDLLGYSEDEDDDDDDGMGLDNRFSTGSRTRPAQRRYQPRSFGGPEIF